MQATAALRIILPGLPDGQKIEAESEAGFEDDEAILALPALRQLVAVEKDMARLVPGRRRRSDRRRRSLRSRARRPS